MQLTPRGETSSGPGTTGIRGRLRHRNDATHIWPRMGIDDIIGCALALSVSWTRLTTNVLLRDTKTPITRYTPPMVEKILSSGTLNLRFMQNARRAQQLPRVEPEHAHVKDDAEWEVSPEVREAWGPSAYRDGKAVTYETSYLPFLFPSLHDTPAADGPSSLSPPNTLRPRGRRVFNKRGEEITQEASSSAMDPAPPQSIDQEASEPTKKSRPHSISSAGVASLTARQSKVANKDPSKDVKNIIFDMTGVGTDLRQSTSMHGTTFLRPSGVDGPADPAKTSHPTKTASQSSTGDTSSSKPKVKRSHTAGEADKPKKKTKLTLIE